MNELFTRQVGQQAYSAGVPQTKIAALLQRAEQISKRRVKTASKKLDVIDALISEAGMQKSASSVSYVSGVLNEALTNGANIHQAIQFTKEALDATAKKVVFIEKVSAIANDPKLSAYGEGFVERAKLAGMSQDDAVALLVDLVDTEKRADGDPSQMFKQAPDAGAGGGAPPGMPPGMDPSAGGGMPPGMDPTGGAGGDPSGGQGGPGASDPQEAQILQMLQSLPPEEQQQVIQQLLAAISGQGGGPSGPGAGQGVPPGPMAPPPQPGPGGPMGAQGPS